MVIGYVRDVIADATGLKHLLMLRRIGYLGSGALIEFPVSIDYPENLRIGAHTSIKRYTWIYARQRKKGTTVSIGEHVEMNPFSTIIGGDQITIGNHVLISPHVSIMSATNSYKGEWRIADNPVEMAPVEISDNVHIGTGAVILKGTRIGEGAVIGAGAVVLGEIPSGAIAVGVPARVVKYREETSRA